MPNDHYVPQFYLRNFELNGKFWVYDKAERRSWISSAGKTNCMRDFYTLEGPDGQNHRRLEAHFAKHESRWNAAVSRAISGKELNELCIHELMEFAAVQYSRTPSGINDLREHLEPAAEIYFDEICSDEDFLRRYLTEKGLSYSVSDFQKMLRSGQVSVNPEFALVSSIAQSKAVYEHLEAKAGLGQLAVVAPPSKMTFATSDSPVNVFWRVGKNQIRWGGIAQPDAQIWLPLSPHLGLLMGPHPGIGNLEEAAWWTNELNKRIIWDARRFIITPYPNDQWSEWAAEAPGGDHLIDKSVLQSELRQELSSEQ